MRRKWNILFLYSCWILLLYDHDDDEKNIVVPWYYYCRCWRACAICARIVPSMWLMMTSLYWCCCCCYCWYVSGALGKAYALLLASRGAAVVVNDLGVPMKGEVCDTWYDIMIFIHHVSHIMCIQTICWCMEHNVYIHLRHIDAIMCHIMSYIYINSPLIIVQLN